jgi:hypothetical protein
VLLDARAAPDRKATRKADQAALATLAERGYTKEERARLRALLKTAQTVIVAEPASDDARTAIERELYGWIDDWGTSAKQVIKRRDHLILLGLAERKKTKKGRKGPGKAAPEAGEAPAAGGEAPPAGSGTGQPG